MEKPGQLFYFLVAGLILEKVWNEENKRESSPFIPE